MNKALGIVAVAGLALAAGVAAGRRGGGGPTASLQSWVGTTCTIYLRSEFDPRASGHYSTGSGSGGLTTVNEYPVAVDGVVADVDATAVTVRAPEGLIWIPRDQIRVIHSLQQGPK